jgi:hypothetical protein
MDSISATSTPVAQTALAAAALSLGAGVSLERSILQQQGQMMSSLLGGFDASGLGRLLDVRV